MQLEPNRSTFLTSTVVLECAKSLTKARIHGYIAKPYHYFTFNKGKNEIIKPASRLFKSHYCRKFVYRLTIDAEDSEADFLIRLLRKLSNTTSLGLNSGYCYQFTEKQLKKMLNVVTFLTKLKRITINMQHCKKLNAASLKLMCKALYHIPYFSHLNLNISNCSGINDAGIWSVSQLLTLKPCITHLTLVCQMMRNFTNQCASYIASALIQLNFLESLILNLGCCKSLDDSGCSQIAEAVGSLSMLRILYLGFYALKSITDQTALILSIALLNLKKLAFLELDVSKCKLFSDNGVRQIVNSIGNLDALQTLNLSFWSLTNISEQTYSMLWAKLERFKSLKSLGIILRACSIGSENYLALAKVLSKKNSLHELTLNTYDCNEIKIEDVSQLIEGILANSYLEILKLFISGCVGITPQRIKELSKQVKSRKNIKAFLIA